MSEAMFEQSINALLDNKFICEYSESDCHRFLSDEQNFNEANAYLNRIGKEVGKSSISAVYYLTYASGHQAPTGHISEITKQIMNDLRPVVSFLEIVMKSGDEDAPLNPGDRVELTRLVNRINEDDTLRSDLDDLVVRLPGAKGRSGPPETNHAKMSHVVRRMESMGYLRNIDTQEEVFVATGKVHVFQEYMDFLIENMPGAQEEFEEEMEQGDLF